jgi:DNA-binding XRE family transcriptional regulator
MKNASTVMRNIEGEATRRGITREELANMIGISLVTYYRRLKDPGSWKLDELIVASRKMRVPIERFMEEVVR